MAIKQGDNGNNVIFGTDLADQLSGLGGSDILWGRGGDDQLDGGSGGDKLWGGSGNDELDGGRGNDILDGGGGHNELEGGLGDDIFIFRVGVSTIEDFALGDDTILIDTALGVDNFRELKDVATSRDDDLIFDFGKHELVLDDMKLSELKPSDFEFV